MYKTFERLMTQKGVTAYKVAKDTGVSQQVLSYWKQGRSIPKADKLQAIADYFDVSLDYLCGGNEEKQKAEDNDRELTEYLKELKNRDELKMLFNITKDASKEDVEKAVKIIEAFLRKDD